MFTASNINFCPFFISFDLSLGKHVSHIIWMMYPKITLMMLRFGGFLPHDLIEPGVPIGSGVLHLSFIFGKSERGIWKRLVVILSRSCEYILPTKFVRQQFYGDENTAHCWFVFEFCGFVCWCFCAVRHNYFSDPRAVWILRAFFD